MSSEWLLKMPTKGEVETSSMIGWVIAGIIFSLFLLLGTRNQSPEKETEVEREEREIEEDLELLLFDEEEEDLI